MLLTKHSDNWKIHGVLNRKAQATEQQEVANPLPVPFARTWAEEQGFHCSETATDPLGTKNLQQVEGWVLSLLLVLLRTYLSFNKSFPAEGESSAKLKVKNLLLV